MGVFFTRKEVVNMIQLNVKNPRGFLEVCADHLESEDANCYASVREALTLIHTNRVAGDVSYTTKIFNTTLQKMQQSNQVSYKVIARYVLNGPVATEQHFPFKVKEEVGRVTAKRYHPESNNFESTNFEPDQSSKTAYIANIPVVFNENFERNNETVRRVLEGFRDQTFGATAELSMQKAPSRVAVVFGANRFKSIEKSKNAAFKQYVASMESDPNIKSSTVGFLWEPKWSMGNTEVGIRRVRSYYIILKRLDPELAERCRLIREQPTEGINDRVPYQEIRETVKNAQVTAKSIEMFRKADKERKVYLAVMDPDFIRLNNDGLGLFSHYNRLIRSHALQHGVAPAVASTGYRANETDWSVLRYGIHLDMRVREAVSRIFPLAVYFPEPNIILSVPPESQTVPESFINQGSVNQESRQIIANILQTREIAPNVALAFQFRGALTTEIPQRFFTATNSYDINQAKIGQLKVLKAISGTRQSILRSVWGWGMSIELAISIKGATARGLTSKLYALFNPIKLSKSKLFDVHSRYSIPRHFDSTMRIYEAYADVMEKIAVFLYKTYMVRYRRAVHLRNISLRTFSRNKKVLALLNEADKRCVFPQSRAVFLSQVSTLLDAYNGLHPMGITPDEFHQLIQASKAAGRAIYTTLNDIRTGRL